MSFSEHIQSFYGITDRFISDQNYKIPYAKISKYLDEIEKLIYSHSSDRLNARFLFLCKNTVLDVLVLLFLIQKKQTFLLVNGNNATQIRSKSDPDFDFTIETKIAERKVLEPSKDLLIEIHARQINIKCEEIESRVMFRSSGTTGTSKTVVHSVENIFMNSTLALKRLRIDKNDRVMIPVPINHMYGFGAALMPSLIAAASVHLLNEASILTIFRGEEESSPTVGFYTPSLLEMYKQLKRTSYHYSKLISAGDSMEIAKAISISKEFGPLMNLYGSTEMGVMATSEINSSSPNELLPLEGVTMEFSLFKKDLKEILCRHPYPFDGYFDQDSSQFKPLDKCSFYQTKDVGHVVDSGKFTVSGRSDLCINRRGVLVSLVEVENQLKELIKKLDQLVVIIGDIDEMHGVKMIACYTSKDPDLDKVQFRRLAMSNLEKYKVPDDYVQLENMPLLPSGKIDRNRINVDLKYYER